jgi:hypothetical protein
LVNGTDEMYCVFLGRATATNAPGAGSVGTAQIADDAVTTAKLNDASVSLAKLTATGTKDATTFLRGDNTFAAAGLNGWSEDGANNNLLPASASAGIYLGVNSATAANLLDDYEEGTWTPTFTSGGNTLTITGGTQNYKYTKIGRQVFIEFNIENSTVSGTTATGDNRITLPFTSSNSGRNPVSIVSYFSTGGLRYTGAEILYGEINRNSSFVQLEEWVPNTGYRNISVAPTTGSGTYFWFCATYTVD